MQLSITRDPEEVVEKLSNFLGDLNGIDTIYYQIRQSGNLYILRFGYTHQDCGITIRILIDSKITLYVLDAIAKYINHVCTINGWTYVSQNTKSFFGIKIDKPMYDIILHF